MHKRFNIFFLLILSSVYGTVLNVPDEYSTIQLAIVNASNGDTVLVADGTYTGSGNKDIDFYGKSVYLKSQNGYESTIIDCENDGRGFYFHLVEDSTTVVDGFTITGGNETSGGGIFIEYSSPKIINTKIYSCYATNGGGFYVGAQAQPIFDNCIIDNNGYYDGARTDKGGNGYIESGSITMSNSIIEDGTADQSAAGIYIYNAGSPVTFNNCDFINNDVYDYNDNAGALYFHGEQLFINDCYFYGNDGRSGGGGLRISSGTTYITGSEFRYNIASS
jgi:hypothetical protein